MQTFFADTVLVYEDPGNQYVIIQYSLVTKPTSNTLIGHFQVYVFWNGDVGYIYNNVYASPISKGSNAVTGEPYYILQHMHRQQHAGVVQCMCTTNNTPW